MLPAKHYKLIIYFPRLKYDCLAIKNWTSKKLNTLKVKLKRDLAYLFSSTTVMCSILKHTVDHSHMISTFLTIWTTYRSGVINPKENTIKVNINQDINSIFSWIWYATHSKTIALPTHTQKKSKANSAVFSLFFPQQIILPIKSVLSHSYLPFTFWQYKSSVEKRRN